MPPAGSARKMSAIRNGDGTEERRSVSVRVLSNPPFPHSPFQDMAAFALAAISFSHSCIGSIFLNTSKQCSTISVV